MPVQHPDLPAHPSGDGLVVGDHDDRGPGPVQLVQQVEDGGIGDGVEVAGGPSASTIAGEPASARATATRCRSPPESRVGLE